MNYFLRPVDSAGGVGTEVGPFITLNVNSEEVTGYLSAKDYQYDKETVVATWVPDRGGWWMDMYAADGVVQKGTKQMIWKGLEIEAR